MEIPYRICPMPQQLDSATLERLRGVSVATIGHVTWDGFLDHRRISPVDGSARIVGTAVTLDLPTPDSSLLHHACSLVRPGDVLVISRAGDMRHACLGGNVGLALAMAGAAGAVVDGPVCDPDELTQHGFPVWSAGISPMTTRRLGFGGRMNIPVSVGGVTVHPGDMVVADCNGVVVVPAAKADGLARKAQAKEESSARRVQDMKAGAKLGELSGATELVLANLEDEGFAE